MKRVSDKQIKKFNEFTKEIDIFLDRNRRASLKEASMLSGRVEKMLPKIANVISRRAGGSVSFTTLGTGYENQYGRFIGYRGYFDNTPIRLNVLMSKSDILHSLDIYPSAKSLAPSETIELNGYNIVQLVDMIADVLSGEYSTYMEDYKIVRPLLKENKKFEERVTLEDMAAAWLERNPQYLKEISDEKFDFENQRLQQEFLNFISTEFRSNKSSINSGAFKWNLRRALENDRNLSKYANPKHIPTVTIKTGVVDKGALLTDPDARAAWEAAISKTGVDFFRDIEEKTRLIANMSPSLTGMLIYGRPGSGKTFNVERVLKEEGADFIAIKGGIKDSTGLLRILYEHSEDKIILFDDNDSVFASPKAINILKIALDNKPIRKLGFGTPIKVEPGKEGMVIPAEFDFTSRIIFLSNQTKIDSALQSRLSGSIFELNLSLDEMYDLIKSKLYNILPYRTDITNEMKEEVFDFLMKLKPVAEDMDFRRYEACLSERSASEEQGNSYWKVRSVEIMKLPKTWEV